MTQHSAGLILYRHRSAGLAIFLVHPGGPYWKAKDAGAWSIPKGLIGKGEAPLSAARREVLEETGCVADGPFEELGIFRLPSGKRLSVWAAEANCEPSTSQSNEFSMEWPPKSGRMRTFPEVDRAAWWSLSEAMKKISGGQRPILVALSDLLRDRARAGQSHNHAP